MIFIVHSRETLRQSAGSITVLIISMFKLSLSFQPIFFVKNTKFSFTHFKYVVLWLSSFVSVSWNLDFSVWTLVWGSDVSVPVCNPLCAACLSTRRPSTCAIDRTSMFACEYVTFTGDISTGPSFMSGGILGKVDGGSMPLLLVKTDTSLWLCIIITQQNWLQLCTGVKVRRQASGVRRPCPGSMTDWRCVWCRLGTNCC